MIDAITNRDPRWPGAMAEIERDCETVDDITVEVAALDSVMFAPKMTVEEVGRLCEAWSTDDYEVSVRIEHINGRTVARPERQPREKP